MSRSFGPLRRVCEEAVAAGVVPGAVVLYADEGAVRFHEAFGARQIEPDRFPATIATVYDVASLTKAVVTSVLTMQAVGDGLVRLDDPVQRHIPELVGAGKDAVTVRHLLGHAGGLPAHRPFYERAAADPSRRRVEILEAAAREALVGPPGQHAVYTDLGFMLLGWILERARGGRLDELAARAIFSPLALAATMFTPLAQEAASAGGTLANGGTGARSGPGRWEIAATERCPWRGRLLVGEVHDQNAWAMDGVAGHAGLFSTAADLMSISRALSAAWRGDAAASTTLVERDVVREFWRPSGVPASTWRLGWDGPAAQGSQAGTRLARTAVGHLGFTGCSLWIDPERERVTILLSNRVHPTVRDDQRFRAFRPAVQDAAIEG